MELLEELENKRSKDNSEAEKQRKIRDRWNEEARKWIEIRDKLNAEVRDFIDQANTHRDARDKYNKEVKNAKEERDIYNKKSSEAAELVSKLKREHLPKGGVPISKLKKDLRGLEFKQQTQVLTPQKERELIDLMQNIKNQIKKKEDLLEENAEIKGAVDSLREAREKAELAHKTVNKMADLAQKEHDTMLELYEKAHKLRKEADKAQEKFVEAKVASDEAHKKHIDLIRQVHDYDKMVFGLRQEQREKRRETKMEEAKKETTEIMDKLKRGEKLSTEDLMVIQKSGNM